MLTGVRWRARLNGAFIVAAGLTLCAGQAFAWNPCVDEASRLNQDQREFCAFLRAVDGEPWWPHRFNEWERGTWGMFRELEAERRDAQTEWHRNHPTPGAADLCAPPRRLTEREGCQ